MRKISFFTILKFIALTFKKIKFDFVLSPQPQYIDLNVKSVDKWYQKKKAPVDDRDETSRSLLTICFY
jgi:hypothetical protein